MIEILKTEQDPSDILPVRQAKKWYQSCMDVGKNNSIIEDTSDDFEILIFTESINTHGLRILESVLMHVGGWPMVMNPDEWDEDNTWQKVEQYFFQLRSSYVFYNFNPPGIGQNSGNNLKIKPGDIPKIGYREIDFRDYRSNNYSRYTDFIVTIAKMFIKYAQAAISDEVIRKDAEDIVEFEKALYSVSYLCINYF